jgi:hypothetical protein
MADGFQSSRLDLLKLLGKVLGMAAAAVIVVFFSFPKSSLTATPDSGITEADERRLRSVLKVLSKAPTGRELLFKAAALWNTSKEESEIWDGLLEHLRWGTASRTDAVLTRHYDPSTHREKREREVTIYLKAGAPIADNVMDLAHELSHATAGGNWDPYDPELTAGKYIWSAIEGKGGEVDAVVAECSVGSELSTSSRSRGTPGRSPAALFDKESWASRCATYRPNLREKIKREFYRVGQWQKKLKTRLGEEAALFPLLTKEDPTLYSSTGRAPYPVALLREFEELTSSACKNSEHRASLYGAGSAEKEFIDARCKRELGDSGRGY